MAISKMNTIPIKHRFHFMRGAISLFCLLLFLFPIGAQAISGNDINDILNGVPYFDSTSGTSACDPQSGSVSKSSNKLFFIGDSLTYGMTNIGNLLTKASTAGYSVSTAFEKSGTSPAVRVKGASVDATGGIAIDETITHLKEHPQDFGNDKVDTFVIGLGTNIDANFIAKIGTLVQYLHQVNPTAKLFWINTYWGAGAKISRSYTDVNGDLLTASSGNGFTIIDIAAAIATNPSLAPDGGDGVHYSPDGYNARSDFIISKLPGLTAVGSGAGSSAGYDPLALTFPNFPDEAAIATGIESTIKSRRPNSPWLKIPNVGQQIIDKSRQFNVNPLFIVASGNIESGFGTSPVALAHNNSFGMKATSTTYRDFPTMADGIWAFIEVIPLNLSGQAASGLYKNVKNIYEYFSVHQTGQIHYPGDGMNIYDPAMDVYISWDPNANASKPGNPQYNPLIYYKANISVINQVTGLNLPSDLPGFGSTTSGTCPESPGNGGNGGGGGSMGSVTANGYAFPMEPQNRSVGGITVGQTVTTHHDGTPAFDLFGTGSAGNVGGGKVYALYGGTVVGVGEEDPGWCYSIQLKADDGFYYWYGHLNGVLVTQGAHVVAGQQMAVTAKWTNEHTCNNTSGATHLHIDRGCTINGAPQPGGSKDCRDPAFIPFLSQIYGTLPPG
jgi:hypothetical protein